MVESCNSQIALDTQKPSLQGHSRLHGWEARPWAPVKTPSVTWEPWVSRLLYRVILKEEFGYERWARRSRVPPWGFTHGPICPGLATQTPPQGKNLTLTHPGAEQVLWYCVININMKKTAKTRCSGEQSGFKAQHVKNKKVKIKRQRKKLNMIYIST